MLVVQLLIVVLPPLCEVSVVVFFTVVPREFALVLVDKTLHLIEDVFGEGTHCTPAFRFLPFLVLLHDLISL